MRLVAVQYPGGDNETLASYEHDGLFRRVEKVVTNAGGGYVYGSDDPNDAGYVGAPAGDRHEHAYYAGWRVIEETDNAETPRTLSQTVFGTRYIDEPVCRDRNTDDDPNCLDSGGSERYYYHQDINFRVVALSDESGAVVERYEYSAYGEPRVYAGGARESGCLLSGSTVGNPHMHQGLRLDDESGLYENRFRMYHARLGRFAQRDPLGYVGGLNLFEYVRGSAINRLDPLGLQSIAPTSDDPKEPVLDGDPNEPVDDPSTPMLCAKGDKWYGFERRRGFDRFKAWYHRQVKPRPRDAPDATREELEELWEEWEELGRPDGDGTREKCNESSSGSPYAPPLGLPLGLEGYIFVPVTPPAPFWPITVVLELLGLLGGGTCVAAGTLAA